MKKQKRVSGRAPRKASGRRSTGSLSLRPAKKRGPSPSSGSRASARASKKAIHITFPNGSLRITDSANKMTLHAEADQGHFIWYCTLNINHGGTDWDGREELFSVLRSAALVSGAARSGPRSTGGARRPNVVSRATNGRSKATATPKNRRENPMIP